MRVTTIPPPDRERIGPYRVERVLGRGGMATVYLGRKDEPFSVAPTVAIKRMDERMAREPDLVARFMDEARLGLRIRHPNVCMAHEIGFDGRVPYLVLEHLGGLSLSELSVGAWRDGFFPPAVAARIAMDAALGLHAAHELCDDDGEPLKVVHRDVSHHNLLVLRHGVTKLLDFGVARTTQRVAPATAAGMVRGKVAFMSPEQLGGGREVDRRSDIWSLGVVLWETTTGQRLFREPTDAETSANVMEKPVPAPSSLVPGYPTDLEEVVLWSLERDPDRRPATAAVLAEALGICLDIAGPRGSHAQVMRLVEYVSGLPESGTRAVGGLARGTSPTVAVRGREATERA